MPLVFLLWTMLILNKQIPLHSESPGGTVLILTEPRFVTHANGNSPLLQRFVNIHGNPPPRMPPKLMTFNSRGWEFPGIEVVYLGNSWFSWLLSNSRCNINTRSLTVLSVCINVYTMLKDEKWYNYCKLILLIARAWCSRWEEWWDPFSPRGVLLAWWMDRTGLPLHTLRLQKQDINR